MEHVFLWTRSGSDKDVPEERENSGFSEEKTEESYRFEVSYIFHVFTKLKNKSIYIYIYVIKKKKKRKSSLDKYEILYK